MSIIIEAQTLEIQAKGVGRMSSDLLIAESFVPSWDVKYRVLTLDGAEDALGQRLKVWKAGGNCGLISLVSILKMAGLDPETLYGSSYRVTVKGKKLEIHFKS